MTVSRSNFNPDELAPTRESLLERLRDLGDQAAWQQFFETYWKLIYCASRKSGLSEHEAEEVVQETIIGISRKMESFRYQPATCSFKGWLMHVTRCRIIDHRRKQQTRGKVFSPLLEDPPTGEAMPEVPDPAASAAFEGMWDEEWQKNLVDAAMEKVKRMVKPEHYQIFYLHSVKNMPASAISELMGASTAKVYVVRHRVAALIRSEIRALENQRHSP
jgi:RNA polymerase sigma factor (sigma-70 family)